MWPQVTLCVPKLSLGAWITWIPDGQEPCTQGRARAGAEYIWCSWMLNTWLFFPLLLRAKVTEFSFTPCSMYAGCTNALKCCWMKGVLCINLLYSTVACVFTLGPEHPARVSGASNLQVHVVARTTNCCGPGSCLVNPAQGFSLRCQPQGPPLLLCNGVWVRFFVWKNPRGESQARSFLDCHSCQLHTWHCRSCWD